MRLGLFGNVCGSKGVSARRSVRGQGIERATRVHQAHMRTTSSMLTFCHGQTRSQANSPFIQLHENTYHIPVLCRGVAARKGRGRDNKSCVGVSQSQSLGQHHCVRRDVHAACGTSCPAPRRSSKCEERVSCCLAQRVASKQAVSQMPRLVGEMREALGSSRGILHISSLGVPRLVLQTVFLITLLQAQGQGRVRVRGRVHRRAHQSEQQMLQLFLVQQRKQSVSQSLRTQVRFPAQQMPRLRLPA